MSSSSLLFEELLASRGLSDEAQRTLFLEPSYADANYDPWLLPDIASAVDRLRFAKEEKALSLLPICRCRRTLGCKYRCSPSH